MPKQRKVVDSMAVEVEGLNSMLRMTRQFGDNKARVNAELREAAGEVAGLVANRARRRASTAQQKLVAPSIRAARDRVPVVQAGGSRRLASSTPRRRQPAAGDVFYGANFGARGGFNGFPAVRRPDYMLYAAVKESRRDITESYLDRVADAFERWG